ncbi:FAD-dependent oxidoreductase [Paenibacillus sp. GP183]|uniref:FAD-dependent oxidoreductase n=1 Tax=Paenibacillus sp. GP183 TaxID=1882751 RepID=UPI000894F810|nr:FAD-dependent oxidoreductase [Paenibacillus sp. GP183]SED09350.1 pyridine nucleotide-disulfide oxidoreductase family protein [Paenibacillus sp. GP183]
MKTLLLIGGGHAHLHILKMLQSEPLPNVKVVLISPSVYQYYSGMISGYVENLYTLDEIRIDLRRLSQSASIQFIQDIAVLVDPAKRILYTEQSGSWSYDAISLDMGSVTAQTATPGVKEHAILVKPMDRFVHLLEKLKSAEQIVVAGGGSSGIELSLAIRASGGRKTKHVSLISTEALMLNTGHHTSLKLTNIFKQKGVRLCVGDAVTSVFSDHVCLKSGAKLQCDELIWVTGPEAPSLFAKSGLNTDDHGYMKVFPTLQSTEYTNVFGAGDCISIIGYPDLPKSGVYAVKEAPVLWSNLKAYFRGIAMKKYHPQKRSLSLLSTGNREALFLYGSMAMHGRWCWKLKRHIDKAFMDKYRV